MLKLAATLRESIELETQLLVTRADAGVTHEPPLL